MILISPNQISFSGQSFGRLKLYSTPTTTVLLYSIIKVHFRGQLGRGVVGTSREALLAIVFEDPGAGISAI
jgi:hypothetical protein